MLNAKDELLYVMNELGFHVDDIRMDYGQEEFYVSDLDQWCFVGVGGSAFHFLFEGYIRDALECDKHYLPLSKNKLFEILYSDLNFKIIDWFICNQSERCLVLRK